MKERDKDQTLAVRGRTVHAAFGFLRRHRSRFFEGFVAGIVAIMLASGIYTVKQEEQAVVTRFGKVVNPEVGPGVRYRMPVIDRAYVHPTNHIVRYQVSGKGGGTINFTIRATGIDTFEVEMALQYRVDNPKTYLFASSDPRKLVTTLVRAELANLMGQSVMHPMLVSNWDMIQRHLFETVARHLESEDIGIELVMLEVLDVRSVEQTQYVFRHGDVKSSMTT